MNKILLAFIAGNFIVCANNIVAFGQSSQSAARPEPNPYFEEKESGSEKINAPRLSGSGYINEISPKAVRNFMQNFKNVSDAKWIKSDSKYIVYFTLNGIQTRVFYDKWGNHEGTIRDYSEDTLPREVRHIIKSTYYDFSIHLINEITTNGIIVYIVKIQDKTSLKTIKVVDGEMEVMKEYKKGG